MRSLLQESQERQLLERQIQLAETNLAESQQTIEAMKTSKFWKLRSRWFRLKQRLGLPAEE
jgi:flagellar biosynthesis regulator FlaF